MVAAGPGVVTSWSPPPSIESICISFALLPIGVYIREGFSVFVLDSLDVGDGQNVDYCAGCWSWVTKVLFTNWVACFSNFSRLWRVHDWFSNSWKFSGYSLIFSRNNNSNFSLCKMGRSSSILCISLFVSSVNLCLFLYILTQLSNMPYVGSAFLFFSSNLAFAEAVSLTSFCEPYESNDFLLFVFRSFYYFLSSWSRNSHSLIYSSLSWASLIESSRRCNPRLKVVFFCT